MEAHMLVTTSFKTAILILLVKQIQFKSSDGFISERPIKICDKQTQGISCQICFVEYIQRTHLFG